MTSFIPAGAIGSLADSRANSGAGHAADSGLAACVAEAKSVARRTTDAGLCHDWESRPAADLRCCSRYRAATLDRPRSVAITLACATAWRRQRSRRGRSGTFAATSTADARRTGGRLVPATGGWAESSLLRRLWPRLVCDAGVSRGRWCARPGTLRPRRFRKSRRRTSPCAGSRRPALALRRRPSCRSHSWGSA